LHYARALRAAASDETAAQRHLRTAWTLKPFAREELVREPRLLPLLRDVRTTSMISYYGAEEPMERSPALAKTPIPLPLGAQALACGNFLRIQIAGAAIDVPGGATLAPPNARIVPATYWKRQDDEAALRDAKTLLEQPARSRSGGGQLRLVRAVEALADHNRWPELLALTNDITPQNSLVPPSLITLRIWALLRADRDADARALANGAAVEEMTARGTFPGRSWPSATPSPAAARVARTTPPGTSRRGCIAPSRRPSSSRSWPRGCGSWSCGARWRRTA
jgi:hypothetical protein